DVVVQAALEGGEGAADVEWRGWSVGVEERSQQPVVELGVEDGDADALGGEDIAVAAGQALDESVQAQAAQVVAHVGAGVGVAEQSGDLPARTFVGEAGDGVDEWTKRAGQSHGAFVPETEGSGSLALPSVGLVDALKKRRADGTALAGTLDDKHAPVDLAGFCDQLG